MNIRKFALMLQGLVSLCFALGLVVKAFNDSSKSEQIIHASAGLTILALAVQSIVYLYTSKVYEDVINAQQNTINQQNIALAGNNHAFFNHAHLHHLANLQPQNILLPQHHHAD